MAEIVNLREARKRRARAAARAAGDVSAARHGRSPAEKEREARLSALEARRLEGHRREGEAGDADRDAPGADD